MVGDWLYRLRRARLAPKAGRCSLLASLVLVASLLVVLAPAAVATTITSLPAYIGAPEHLIVSPDSQTWAVGATATITVTETDANQTPVSNIGVTFVVSGVNNQQTSILTDFNGQAIFTCTSQNPGTDQVTVWGYGGQNQTVTVNWLGPAASVSLEPSATNLNPGDRVYLTATVRDSAKDLLPGVDVQWLVNGANSLSFSNTTGSSGVVSYSYVSAVGGNDTVTAYVDLNGDGRLDNGEPYQTVNIYWAMPTPPPNQGGSTGPGSNPGNTGSSFAPAQPAQPRSGCLFFSETQHNVCAGFLSYWQQFGGLTSYGLPLTEEFVENGVTVQYFERARFEWHPGSNAGRYDVELGLLGDEQTVDLQGKGAFQPVSPAANPLPPAASNCTYFQATGHNLCSNFYEFWQKFGGLSIYGMPISEPFQEVSPDTGETYTVQYFERARMELHPGGWPSHFDGFLGRLGAEQLQARYGVSY
ncbi:MAG TPA: Ig-like domain-containing protein [Thermomicrobiaceae bacterium]|nr:Ig-like domain-containing protein [Thermomicrobiaceae bacterium]